MNGSLLPRQATADDYREFQRAWQYVSRPLVRHLTALMTLGSPRLLQKSDGTLEMMEPEYPAGVTEMIAEVNRMLDSLRKETALKYGLPVEHAIQQESP